MRFDKNIWDPSCKEYGGRVSEAELAYFNEPTKLFVSTWLERLQDDWAPVTRRLNRLCLLDLVEELVRVVRLWRKQDKTVNRMVASLEEFAGAVAEAQKAGHSFPGEAEAIRLQGIVSPICKFLKSKNNKKKENDESWREVATALRYAGGLAGTQQETIAYLAGELLSIVNSLKSALRGDEGFKRSLVIALKSTIEATALPALERIEYLVCELLAYFFRRGYSREHLANLPIKFLRADKHEGKSLEERVKLFFGAFSPRSTQCYLVCIPLRGPRLAVESENLPHGIKLSSKKEVLERFLSSEYREIAELSKQIQDTSFEQALLVDIAKVAENDSINQDYLPHDVGSARDAAIRVVRQFLDAVFLLRSVVPSIMDLVFVYVTGQQSQTEPTFGCKIEVSPVNQPSELNLRRLKAVPAEWVDALHWYREGCEDPSAEVGIVNLWTAVELLSRSDRDSISGDLERVQSAVGALASLVLIEAEMGYIGRAIVSFLQINDDPHDCFYRFVSEESADDITRVFQAFPRLGATLVQAKNGQYFKARLAQIEIFVAGKLAWAYGYRNAIVHEGQRGLPGAEVARELLAKLTEAALRLTLNLEFRCYATSLEECFQWARQQLRTLHDAIATDDISAYLNRVKTVPIGSSETKG